MSDHELGKATPRIALKACVDELRRRCETVARLQGGNTYYQEELGIFREFATEKALYANYTAGFLNRAPDDEGNEHQVWFDCESSSYLKATWPDFFGMLVVHRYNEDAKASPIAYLERWQLHNELFGDRVEFLGVLEAEEQIRMIIRQPAICGIPASDEQIETFFTSHGWQRFSVDGEIAFFDEEKQVVISDTHRGNIILMDDGLLAPIDLRVQRISGAQLDIVSKLCNQSTGR